MASRKRLLFVDDEPSIRLTLPPVLEDHGFEVIAAGSVAEAVDKIASAHFDVLLSDLNIGEDGDGFRVVTAMRKSQPQCITLILTGYPAFESALLAIRHQVDDYLVKPTDIDVLVKTINHKLSEDNRSAVGQNAVGEVQISALRASGPAQYQPNPGSARDAKAP